MENLVHRAVEPGVDRCDRHVLFDQPREFGLVGPLFLQRRPGNLRIHEKGRAWTGGAEHERRRGVRGCVRIEHVVAVTHIDFGFEMRRLEMVVADLDHLPEVHVRTGSVPRQIRRRHAERISLDLERRAAAGERIALAITRRSFRHRR